MTALDLSYALPADLIAQHPADRRGESRLLVVESGSGEQPRPDAPFAQSLLEQVGPDDLVVANDTRVLRARLRASRPGGGSAELLLLEPCDEPAASRRWRCMARPARRLRDGMRLELATGEAITCIERDHDGSWIVELPGTASVDAAKWLDGVGEVPLPPYITASGQDPDRYQTIWAREPGSVAAPTAGLHFDGPLWQRLREHCEVAHVTLHVGAGTFQPVRDGDVTRHQMHHERYEVPATTDAAVRSALSEGRRVVAIGTTTTRTLESVYGPSSLPLTGRTNLFISPGYRFGCVGALLTNFHLPGSSLLALVMAFAGTGTIRTAYAAAIDRRMRFYSFGDAMFIHGRPPALQERP